MVTKHVIKQFQMENGKIFATFGELRKLFAECSPFVRIYRQDNPVNILGRTSYGLKSYHVALVLCGQPQFAPGMGFECISRISGYDMTARVMDINGFVEKLTFEGLYPETIDPYEEWVFTMDLSNELLNKLLKLKPIDSDFNRI